MALLVERSVVESFSFNGRNVRSVHVPDLGVRLVDIDVPRAIGYVDGDNGRRAIKRHVPQKYTMQTGQKYLPRVKKIFVQRKL